MSLASQLTLVDVGRVGLLAGLGALLLVARGSGLLAGILLLGSLGGSSRGLRGGLLVSSLGSHCERFGSLWLGKKGEVCGCRSAREAVDADGRACD